MRIKRGTLTATKVTLIIPTRKFDKVLPILEGIGSIVGVWQKGIYDMAPWWDEDEWDEMIQGIEAIDSRSYSKGVGSANLTPTSFDTLLVGEAMYQYRMNGVNFDLRLAQSYDDGTYKELEDIYLEEAYEWAEAFREQIDHGHGCVHGEDVLASLEDVLEKYKYKVISLDDGKKVTEESRFQPAFGSDS